MEGVKGAAENHRELIENRRSSQVLDCTEAKQIQLASIRMRFQKPKWVQKFA